MAGRPLLGGCVRPGGAAAAVVARVCGRLVQRGHVRGGDEQVRNLVIFKSEEICMCESGHGCECLRLPLSLGACSRRRGVGGRSGVCRLVEVCRLKKVRLEGSVVERGHVRGGRFSSADTSRKISVGIVLLKLARRSEVVTGWRAQVQCEFSPYLRLCSRSRTMIREKHQLAASTSRVLRNSESFRSSSDLI